MSMLLPIMFGLAFSCVSTRLGEDALKAGGRRRIFIAHHRSCDRYQQVTFRPLGGKLRRLWQGLDVPVGVIGLHVVEVRLFLERLRDVVTRDPITFAAVGSF